MSAPFFYHSSLKFYCEAETESEAAIASLGAAGRHRTNASEHGLAEAAPAGRCTISSTESKKPERMRRSGFYLREKRSGG